jgi:PAS domain S-box-containing protein
MARAGGAGGGEVTEVDLQLALDRIAADSVPLVAGGLALLLCLFAILDPFLYARPWNGVVAITDLASAALCAGVFFRAWREGIPPGLAHPFLLLLAGVPVLDVLRNLFLAHDLAQTLYLVIAAVGAGSVFLSTLWLLPLLALIGVGWAAARGWGGGPFPVTLALTLLAASVVSLLIQLVRVRTYRRLEVLRIAAEKASEERDMREQALEAAVSSAWESEQRYRRLVEDAPDAFLVHSGGRILYANAAAVRLLRAKSADDLMGRNPLELYHPDFRDVARVRNRQVERGGEPTELLEMKLLRLDGNVVDVETMGQPIMYEGRVADQSILRDITDRKRAETERSVAAARLAEIARLQELDRMKTQFVNTLSHELRTPLTPIKVQLHLLKSANGDPARTARATEMLERNVSRMGGLIDELLEVARLQAGTLKLDRCPLDLDVTVGEALESFKDVAKQNGVQVDWTLEPGLHVEADPRRMTQIMYNLMNNALKFTPEGGRITVDARHEGRRAVVKVSDTGVGIKPEDLARLFEPFSQLHDTMQKTNSGTGLGLYICKGIVEGHGGRIWCDSPGPGKGTTFAFDVPLIP